MAWKAVFFVDVKGGRRPRWGGRVRARPNPRIGRFAGFQRDEKTRSAEGRTKTLASSGSGWVNIVRCGFFFFFFFADSPRATPGSIHAIVIKGRGDLREGLSYTIGSANQRWAPIITFSLARRRGEPRKRRARTAKGARGKAEDRGGKTTRSSRNAARSSSRKAEGRRRKSNGGA